MLCCCAVVWCAGLVVLALGSALVARHRAASAADLGALAGAQAMLAGTPQICGSAQEVITAHGARLTACVLEPDERGSPSVRVVAEVPFSFGRLHFPAARAQARAGPGVMSKDDSAGS